MLHSCRQDLSFPEDPAWARGFSHGLGSLNDNLPNFVTLVTKGKGGQPLVSRLWGSGFLPGKHAGTRFRADKDAILYLNSPNGVNREGRAACLIVCVNFTTYSFSVQETRDLRRVSPSMRWGFVCKPRFLKSLISLRSQILLLVSMEARKPGTYAANCLLARRLAEKDVRFIQLYHPGWDQHGGLPGGIRRQCKETDKASAALITDLKNRGMLEDTLVIWGGEFGRTNYCQGSFNPNNFGRDHHPRCFSMWMAGGDIKSGTTFGKTDDYGYNIAEDGVHIHDLHATILHLLGIDHERLTYKYQGRHFRLTDVHGHVVRPILS